MAKLETKVPRLWLDQKHNERLSLADAMEIIRQQPGFTGQVSGRIRTSPIALPTDDTGSLVLLHCDQNNIAVPLATSCVFVGRDTFGKDQEFNIDALNDAIVDDEGNVKLANGTHIRAVRLCPAQQMRELQDNDWTVVEAAVAFTGSADRCYRYVDKDIWPEWKGIDFSALRSIKVQGLKDFTTFLQRRYHLHLKEQTVANTLRKCGIPYSHRK